MDLTKQRISHWLKDFRCQCYVITLFILLKQVCGINHINNSRTLIWQSSDFSYNTDYIKRNELLIEISSKSDENETSICIDKRFTNQTNKLRKISIIFTVDGEIESEVSFQCADTDVHVYPFNTEKRPEQNISVFYWSLHSIPDGFTENEVIETITQSLLDWSHEIPVDFNDIGRNMNAYITISFHTTLQHATLYDNQSTDCPAIFKIPVIAHAFPIDHKDERFRGQIHFNDFLRQWSL